MKLHKDCARDAGLQASTLITRLSSGNGNASSASASENRRTEHIGSEGPEGQPAKCQPSPEGLGQRMEDDPERRRCGTLNYGSP
jgi:hypothetical protein